MDKRKRTILITSTLPRERNLWVLAKLLLLFGRILPFRVDLDPNPVQRSCVLATPILATGPICLSV